MAIEKEDPFMDSSEQLPVSGLPERSGSALVSTGSAVTDLLCLGREAWASLFVLSFCLSLIVFIYLFILGKFSL